MLIKAGDVIGLRVVTMDEGKEVDRVHDVVYDPKENRVKALVIDEGGWFSDAKVLLIEDIYSIGKDAVVIESEERIRKAVDVNERVASIAREEQKLTKTKVITENGINLGAISDILFDTATGRVEEFEVSQGLKNLQSGRKTVRVDQVMTVGEDVTVVKAGAEEQLKRQAEQRGVQGTFNRTVQGAKENIPAVTRKVKEGAKDVVEATREKAREFRNDPRTQGVIERTLHNIQRIQEDLEQEARSAEKKIKDLSEQARRAISESASGERRVSGVKGGYSERRVTKVEKKTIEREDRDK